MAKVLFPRNVQKGLFNMNMNIGPLNVSLVQVFILMLGLGGALGAFQLVSGGEGGSKTLGLIVAIPVLLGFVFVAFFRMAEMGLLEFLVKLARDNFFDSSKKYQTQYTRIADPHHVLLKRIQTSEKKEKIETKTLLIDEEDIAKFREGGLL